MIEIINGKSKSKEKSKYIVNCSMYDRVHTFCAAAFNIAYSPDTW